MRNNLLVLAEGSINQRSIYCTGYDVDHPWQTALTIGLILSLSSAIVLQTLSEGVIKIRRRPSII